MFILPKIVGIINTTSDSFYAKSRCASIDEVLFHADRMISEGVDILDVGGESTRPGSEYVSEDIEQSRVLPAISEIRKRFPDIPVSIDTRRFQVARVAVENGASMINDVSALSDERMALFVAEKNIPVVLLHMQGTPRDMQEKPLYNDVVQEVKSFLHDAVQYAKSKGVRDSQIILDPGIGFGKTCDHNTTLLANLSILKTLGYPLYIGASRKRFISHIVEQRGEGERREEDRLAGTIATQVLCMLQEVEYLRVHDVQAAKDASAITKEIMESSYEQRS